MVSGHPPGPGRGSRRWSAVRRSTEPARAAAERVAARAQEKSGIRLAINSLRSEQRSGAGLLAGGLAYRFFLWLVPFGLAVAAIASFWVRLDAAGLEDAAKRFGLGGVAAHSATAAIEEGSRARWYLLLAGLVLAAWAGVAAVRALRIAALIAWRLEPDRLRRPLRASATFAAVSVIGLAASVGASMARKNLGGFGLLITLADAVVYALLALFAFIHLPRPEGASWETMWPGALMVGCGATGVHVFLAYYLAGKLEKSPKLYGTLGASTVVLLVLFLLARLFVSAMYLNATLQRAQTTSPD